MKLIKWFLNLLYFTVLLCGMYVASVGCNFFIGMQTGESDATIVVWSIDENSYGINDACTFIVDNVGTNYKLYSNDAEINYSSAMFVLDYGEDFTPVTINNTSGSLKVDSVYLNIQGPKARARNWFGWEWWSTYVGSWLDYGIDFVASIGSPILLPTYNAANLTKFYNPNLSPDDPLTITPELLADMSSKYGPDYVTRAIQDLYAIRADMVLPGSAITTYHKWIKAYSHFYDYMFNIAKYNAVAHDAEGNAYKVFEKYYQKIVVNRDGVDDGRLNSNVVFMYYTILIDFLAAIFVVRQYPITTAATEDGEVEVKGGLFRKRKKKNRKAGFLYRLFHRKKDEEGEAKAS